MPSADFCTLTHGVSPGRAARTVASGSGGDSGAFAPGLSPAPMTTAGRMKCRSPRIRTWTFRTQPPHLPCPVTPAGFVMLCWLALGLSLLCGFCSSARAFALGLPPDTTSRWCPCRRL